MTADFNKPADPLGTTDHVADLHANDPLRTTDHSPASSVVVGGTGAYTESMDTEPERAPESVSVPGYEIEGVLGRGGMGVVYKARHSTLKRTVALKMILAGGHAGPRELARFRIEAEAVARLQHPNIVQIHEVGEAGGRPYCALEFVEGGNLAGKIDGKPMPAKEAAKLVEVLARAMQLAHSRNVVHRDLKPANILLAADGTPKITDFGLARQLDSDSGETQAGAVMGTPSYMAPEQASGRAHEAGPAADVYALGAILYACLAGRPPFKGKTMVETLDQVRTQEPVPPSRWQKGVPLDLETICLKCLRKEPENRYASAAALADELARYQQGEPILARSVGRIERAVKWVKRNPVVTAMAAVVVLTMAVGTTVTYLKYLDAEEQKGIALQALHKEEQARRDRVLAQVGTLLDVAPQAVPAILAALEPFRDEIRPLLRQAAEKPEPPEVTAEASRLWRQHRARAALALLTEDAAQVEPLTVRLLENGLDPAEMLLVRDALTPHSAGLKDDLWRRAEAGNPAGRFRTLVALAAFDPDSRRWAEAATGAVAQLLSENPLHLGQWVQAFRPVRAPLLNALAKVYREAKSPERRELAATLLADYAADRPHVLADLLMDADEKQFALIYPKFKEQKRGLPVLTGEIDRRAVAVKDKMIFESKGKIAADDAKVKTQGGPIPAKRFEVRLQAGKTYRLTMDSKDLDSFLVLQDKTGKELAFDDDGGGNLNSLIVYTPASDDTYAVFAASLPNAMIKGTGTFVLKVMETASGGDAKDKLAKRQANAAVALLKMNRSEKVWPLLQHSPDPSVRSYLIHRLGPLGADAQAIIKRLNKEPDITIRRALLLSLGAYGEKDVSLEDRKALLPKLQQMYRTASDPGLHGAAEWLLRTWKQEPWLQQVNQEWARDKEQRAKRLDSIQQLVTKEKEKAAPQWYVNGQGQTMVVIPGPVEFVMGSPLTEADRRGNELQHNRRIGRTFVLAATAVTKEQFLRFAPEFGHSEMRRYPEPACPIGGVVWYEAAVYCNWLSKQEGIPADQWCYEIKGNMVKLKEKYLSLSGYRLPTEAEMECATRAGALTSRDYGETEELLPKYAWYFKNSQDRTWPVGSLKPNDLGLFDVQGNLLTWCQEGYTEYKPGKKGQVVEDQEDVLVIDDTRGRVLRGGSFASHASVVRSANRNSIVPTSRLYTFGLRPARTLPPGSFPQQSASAAQ